MSTQIAKISVFSHANDLGGKVWNPAIRWTTKYSVFIVIEDDQGVQGVGECWCFDSAPDTLNAFLKTEVLPHFVGCTVEGSQPLFEQLISRATLTARHGLLASALSGVDIALADLEAKLAELPLHQFLAPQSESQTVVYASGGLYGENKDEAALSTEMCAMVSDGFNLLKMKIGALSIQQDLARIEAVLDALPREVNLIIDGVYSYTVDSAQQLFHALPPSRIVAFQSPLPASDISGMAVLNNAGVPVMATEAEYRTEIHQRLLEHNAVTFLQTAPIASGGVRRIRALHQSIKDTPVRLSLEVSSTAVAFLVAAHLSAAYNSVAHVEYHYVHQVFFDQLPGRVGESGTGIYALSDNYGLGIELDTSKVKHEFTLSSVDN